MILVTRMYWGGNVDVPTYSMSSSASSSNSPRECELPYYKEAGLDQTKRYILCINWHRNYAFTTQIEKFLLGTATFLHFFILFALVEVKVQLSIQLRWPRSLSVVLLYILSFDDDDYDYDVNNELIRFFQVKKWKNQQQKNSDFIGA